MLLPNHIAPATLGTLVETINDIYDKCSVLVDIIGKWAGTGGAGGASGAVVLVLEVGISGNP
jgi:hypothetical protein